jgi:ligand-binding sensor domain-containing protein
MQGVAVSLFMIALMAGGLYYWKVLLPRRKENALRAQLDQLSPLVVTEPYTVTHITVTPSVVWAALHRGRDGPYELLRYTLESETHLWCSIPDGAKIKSLLAEEHNLWVGTDGQGLFHGISTSGCPTLYPIPDVNENVLSVAQDAHGDLWVGTKDGLYHSEQGDWRGPLTEVQELCSGSDPLLPLWVMEITVSKDNTLWMTTLEGSLIHWSLDEADGQRACYQREGGILSIPTSLALDTEGRPWTGTSDGNVELFREKGLWKPYRTSSEKAITSLVVLNDNSLLAGTQGDGLLLYAVPTQRWVSIYLKEGQVDKIYDIVRDANGRIWLGTNHGLFEGGDD